MRSLGRPGTPRKHVIPDTLARPPTVNWLHAAGRHQSNWDTQSSAGIRGRSLPLPRSFTASFSLIINPPLATLHLVTRMLLVWTAPGGIERARMRSCD